MTHHIVIIGGGPGGTAAAFEAVAWGAQVTLIEKDELGGTCLNRGCIPTKTILKSAKALDGVRNAGQLAITVSTEPSLDLEKLRERKARIVNELRDQLEKQCKRMKIEVLKGTATIEGDFTVSVEFEDGSERQLSPDAVIVATGSVPTELPFIDHSLSRVWTSDDALELTEIPDELIVMGGGVIGVELATAYAAFGSKVTIVELADHILPYNDARTARTLASALKRQGIEIKTKTSVTGVAQEGNRVIVTLEGDDILEVDILLCAVGRTSLLPQGYTVGSHDCPTPYPCVVIGDASGGIMLAHAAEAQGEIAAHNVMAQLEGSSLKDMPDDMSIPACVYTHPEVASIGLNTEEAKKQQREVATGIAKFTGNGRALAEGDTDGFVSLVADKQTGEVLGAQIVGPHAVELVAEVAIAMRMKATVQQFSDTVFAHPTVSEAIKVAARLAAAQVC